MSQGLGRSRILRGATVQAAWGVGRNILLQQIWSLPPHFLYTSPSADSRKSDSYSLWGLLLHFLPPGEICFPWRECISDELPRGRLSSWCISGVVHSLPSHPTFTSRTHTHAKPQGDHWSKTSPRSFLSDDGNSLTSFPHSNHQMRLQPLFPIRYYVQCPFPASTAFSTAGLFFLESFPPLGIQDTRLSFYLDVASFSVSFVGSHSLLDPFSSPSPPSQEMTCLAPWLNTIYVFNVCM